VVVIGTDNPDRPSFFTSKARGEQMGQVKIKDR
jgi:hypothetical protein